MNILMLLCLLRHRHCIKRRVGRRLVDQLARLVAQKNVGDELVNWVQAFLGNGAGFANRITKLMAEGGALRHVNGNDSGLPPGARHPYFRGISAPFGQFCVKL